MQVLAWQLFKNVRPETAQYCLWDMLQQCDCVQVCKQQGYTVVGVEQTSESLSLPEYHFDKRTVLLLGKEQEGIPAHLLSELDACVEIPQFGTLRSLNVHVSGALSVYEYVKQISCTQLVAQ